MAHVAKVLARLHEEKLTSFEMSCHVNNVMEFSSDEGFVQYQVELLNLWCMRYRAVQTSLGKHRQPACENVTIPNVSKVAGPGMVPFAATLAPNLFDMPGTDRRPAKRMRLAEDDEDASSLASSATKVHKRHAVVVTEFLEKSACDWIFLERVLDMFDLAPAIIDYHVLQFFQCELRRLLCNPQLRGQEYPDDLAQYIGKFKETIMEAFFRK